MGICGSKDRTEIIIPTKYKEENSEISNKNTFRKTEKTTSIPKKIRKEPTNSNLSNYQKSKISPKNNKNLFESPRTNHRKIIFDSPDRNKINNRNPKTNLGTIITKRTKMRNLKSINKKYSLNTNSSSNTKEDNLLLSPVLKYKRRNRKSISLVEKSKLGSQIIKEELKLK